MSKDPAFLFYPNDYLGGTMGMTFEMKGAYIDLLIHEQYFYPFYSNYQPDYKEKVLTAVKWAADKGYEPAFLGDCVF